MIRKQVKDLLSMCAQLENVCMWGMTINGQNGHFFVNLDRVLSVEIPTLTCLLIKQ